MTLHFHWPYAPRWLTYPSANRAMTLMLGIIGVSLLFGALRVVDAAVARGPAATPLAVPVMTAVDPAAGDAEPMDADLVEVPDATAEAVSL